MICARNRVPQPAIDITACNSTGSSRQLGEEDAGGQVLPLLLGCTE